MEYTSENPLYVRVSEKMQTKSEITGDFILPDNYEDIRKILHTSAALCPERAELSSSKLISEGRIILSVLFEDDNGKINSVDFSRDFQISCTADKSENRSTLLCMPSIESLSIKLINPRKVGARITVDTNAKLWEENSTNLEMPESFTANDRLSVEKKEEYAEQLCVSVTSDSTREISEDIELDRGVVPMEEILMSDLEISVEDVRRNKDALTLKGTVSLLVLYRDVEGGIAYKNTELPFVQDVDASGLPENENAVYIAKVYVDKKSTVPGENAFGENKVIELDFSYTVYVASLYSCGCKVTRDAYSTEYNTENVTANLRCSTLLPMINGSENRTVEGECEEEKKLICVFPEWGVKNENGEEAKITVKFTAVLENQNGTHSSLTLNDSFDLDKGEMSEFVVSPSLRIIQAVCENGKLRIQYSVNSNVAGWKNGECSCVSSIKLSENAEKREYKALTVYYPQSDESLWDVAKKYRISENVLMCCNMISDPSEKRNVLLIPKKRKADFSKII